MQHFGNEEDDKVLCSLSLSPDHAHAVTDDPVSYYAGRDLLFYRWLESGGFGSLSEAPELYRDVHDIMGLFARLCMQLDSGAVPDAGLQTKVAELRRDGRRRESVAWALCDMLSVMGETDYHLAARWFVRWMRE